MKKILTFLVSFLFLSNLIFAQPVPTNGAVNTSVIPDFEWTTPVDDPIPANTEYRLQVFSTDTYTTTNLVLQKNNLSAGQTTYTFDSSDLMNDLSTKTQLDFNHTYYWRIRKIESGVYSTFEGEYSFTTKTHYLTSPVNTVTGVPILPTFEWEGDASLDYNLYIATDDQFTTGATGSTIAAINVGNAFTYTFSENDMGMPLLNNKQYYWKVESSLYESQASRFTTFGNVNLTMYFPSNGMSLYAFEPAMFSWGIGTLTGQLTFDLQYMPSTSLPTDWSGATTHGDINDSFYNDATLVGGTKYFWRVIAKYDGEVVKYSTPKHFTTKGGAVQPILSWPTGGNYVYTQQPALYWYTMTGTTGVTFTVRYSTTAAVDGVLTSDFEEVPNIADLYYQILVDLEANSTYFWQVQSVYNGVTSDWSKVAKFKTKGEGTVYKPIPSYPVSGLKLYTLTPTFHWYINGLWDGVVEYDLFVYEGSKDPSYFIHDNADATTTDLFFDWSVLTELEAGKTYKWRVRAFNGAEVKLSDVGTFKTAGGSTSSIVLTYPVKNQLLYITTPTLGWYVYGAYQGFDSYVVKYKLASDDTEWDDVTTLSTIGDIYQTTYTFDTELDYGATYRWAVATFNNGTRVSNWKAAKFSIIGNSKAKVNLSVPAHKSTVSTLTPILTWYLTGNASEVDHFRVTYSDTELFVNNPNNTTVAQTSESYLEIGTDLEPGHTYYWFVEVSFDGSNYIPSKTWRFTVTPGANAVVPRIGSPNDGMLISENNPTLSWFIPVQSESTLNYEVEVANNESFDNAKVLSNISDLQTEMTQLDAGNYFWRVKSSTGSDESSYSDVGTFSIDGAVSVDNEEQLPTVYSLEQNYPNPFNPETKIKFSLAEAQFVTIKIYNMLGQEVRTLLNEQKNNGNYSVIWNGKDSRGNQLASGTYIYRINAGDFSSTKKMVYLK